MDPIEVTESSVVQPDATGSFDSLVAEAGFPIVVIALVVVAVITVFKHVLKTVSKNLLDLKGFQIALELAPILLGVWFGLVPGVFPLQYSPAMCSLLGCIAGFMSPTIYGFAKKRLPWFMLSKEGRDEHGDQ